jgi:hypothetical protein
MKIRSLLSLNTLIRYSVSKMSSRLICQLLEGESSLSV